MKAIAEFIYEATRLEAEWSNRSIVAEKWDKRDEKFRKQFVNIIETYFKKDKLPTPEEAHDSWVRAYEKMGWVYGKKRDAIKKTHPDILPFDELPKDERDKDSIFLVFVWLAKQITMTQLNKPKTGKERKYTIAQIKKLPMMEMETGADRPENLDASFYLTIRQFRNGLRHQLLEELKK